MGSGGLPAGGTADWPGPLRGLMIRAAAGSCAAWSRASSNFSISSLLDSLIALPAGPTTSRRPRACLNGEHKACAATRIVLAIANADPSPDWPWVRAARRGRSAVPRSPGGGLRLQHRPAGSRHLLYADPASHSCREARSLRIARSEQIHPSRLRISGSTRSTSSASLRSLAGAFQQLDQGDGFEVPSVLASRRLSFSPRQHSNQKPEGAGLRVAGRVAKF